MGTGETLNPENRVSPSLVWVYPVSLASKQSRRSWDSKQNGRTDRPFSEIELLDGEKENPEFKNEKSTQENKKASQRGFLEPKTNKTTKGTKYIIY